MKPGVLIISPDFPPARGGVADHTLRLAQELFSRGPVAVLTSSANQSNQPFPVHAEISDWTDPEPLERAIATLVANKTLLWQYVPHMYGRGGVNAAIGKVMHRLQRHAPGQLVIAHEIAAPFSPLPHRFWYAFNHRRQWRQLLAAAGAVGISSEAWLAEWTRREPQHAGKLFLLSSPSTIPVVPVPATHARDWRVAHQLPADCRVLAYFGTMGANKQFDWVLAAWERAQKTSLPVALVLAGGDATITVPDALRSLFRPLGYLPADDVSRLLQAADVLALPFIDGVSERRTSFMAGLSHGCAVATTLGHNTGSTLRHAHFFAATEATDEAGFVTTVQTLLTDDALRTRLATAGRHAYHACYDWPRVIEALDSARSKLASARRA